MTEATRAESTSRLAVLLVASAGYVDGYGLFTYRTFLSFMSGNTTLTGYDLGRGNLSAALLPAIAIAGFLFGATIGTWLTRTHPTRASGLVLAAVAGVQILLIAFAGFGLPISPIGVAVLSAAMGVLNQAVTQIGEQHINLTFVTGMLVQLADLLAHVPAQSQMPGTARTSDARRRSAAELAGLWASFFAGALLAGVVVPRLGIWSLGPSAVTLTLLAFVDINH